MQLQIKWLPLLACCLALVCAAEGRRVRVRPRPVQQEESLEDDQYYAQEPQAASQRGLVLVSSDDEYNGLYGQQSVARDNYIPQQRTQSLKPAARTKESPKAPPVATIRNYNKVNDDGSFTFGYESADGSFKEETRGTDCVVRGKYGYIDPDGNKREFTYVSGNPCDPNAVNESDEEDRDKSEPESDEPENIPANYPQRPIRPITTTSRPPTTVFQNNYYDQSQEQEYDEPEPVQPVRQHISSRPTPSYVHTAPQQSVVPLRQRQRIASTTPATYYQPSSVSITPRPAAHSPLQTLQTQPPATTYRPQLLQLDITPRPASVSYQKPSTSITAYPAPTSSSVSSTRGHLNAIPSLTSSTRGQIDFAAEFAKFQQENNIISSTPSGISKPERPTQKKVAQPVSSANPVYSSELVYDPSTGQYNNALYQSLPQTEGDFSLNYRIQPYVHQQPSRLVSLGDLQQQSPLYRQQITHNNPAQYNQQTYHQQQNEHQFQSSQQLFAQQQQLQQAQLQRDRQEAAKLAAQRQQSRPQSQHQPQQQSNPHRFQLLEQDRPQGQAFYYIQPSVETQHDLAGGQIESFLRGHNIDF